MESKPIHEELTSMPEGFEQKVSQHGWLESVYLSVVESTSDSIYLVDKDCRYLFINNHHLTRLGLKSEQIIGRRYGEFHSQEQDREFTAMVKKVFSTCRSVQHEHRSQRDNRYFLRTFSPVKEDGSQGKITSVVVVSKDINERKDAERALRESEMRYRTIFENTGTAKMIIDEDNSISLVNSELMKQSGFSREELEGKRWTSFVVKEELERLKEYYGKKRVDPVTTPMKYETRLIDKTGSIRDTYITVSLIPGTNKRVASLLDLTEIRRMEGALRQSEEKYRTILETMEDSYVEIDMSGKLTFFNPVTCRMLGYSADEMTGMSYRKLMDEATAGKIKKIFNNVLKTGKAETIFEYELLKKDGTKVYVEISVSLMKDANGNAAGFRATGRNITERKKLESQFHQAQKMEAIGTLAGGIAHDFNNILMGIQGHASLMMINLEPDHPHYEKLKIIEEQVRSGADLTRQLLGFARRGKYDPRPTNLNEIIEKTSVMFGRTKKEITIHKKYQEDIWVAEVDQGQIEQVLLNLYVNAWQAMPGGGDLYLETQNVTLDENTAKRYSIKTGNYVKITVTDTGVGMDEKTRERIFEPFFTTKEMGRGTGLGLASAYGITKGHGGIINVYSEKGYGSAFKIYFPVLEKVVEKEEEPSIDIFRGHETILLVDDEEVIIDVSGEFLEVLGYKVIVARSGQEAVDIYKERGDDIDLVLLDVIMPGMGGKEAFDIIRAINPDIKVIFSSGYSLIGRPEKMLEQGYDGFIQKPYSISALSQKIREVLDKKT